LGGPSRDRIRCYATGNDTDWYLSLGFDSTKVACPYGPAEGWRGLDLNEEFIAAKREEVGPERELMVDCWMAFDVDFAVRFSERMRPYRLRWIEDCLMPDDLDGQAELRRRLPLETLATGEHWYTPAVFASSAARRSADVFQPDIGWAGGLTGCVKISQIAAGIGISVVPHAGINTPYGQHFGMWATNSPCGEYFVASPPGVPLAEVRLTPGMQVPENGFVTPTDDAGFGLGLSLDSIEAMVV
jgi:L-rhamnonate dehydratase